ncbi:MAG TPA: TfoX/Sxy family protein [Candidatus Thermoplasmatota archaeon]|nr:TfoX/Sxy family protein [Candidatus Thermoplasmatota archaeon]
MPNDPSFVDYVLDQLRGVKAVSARPMFGGHGLYSGGTIFGVMDDGRVYLKVSDATRPDFEARGMGPFEYAPGKRIKTYYELPEDIIENPDEFAAWANKAIAAKRAGEAKKGAKKPATKKPAAKKTTRK